ncbi:MAG: 3-dehydroquinate synthase [Prolixibacteraceae bacterium]|nr:3-dehydroquinate synthase [Prolixibacteraceae bacterium]
MTSADTNPQSSIIFSRQITEELEKIINSFPEGKTFLLTEETPEKLCLPILQPLLKKKGIRQVVIPGGENNKSTESVTKVWEFLSKNGADRKSLLINLGGGMLTDLGGFSASTFKRGMAFVNIPTTLLSQVDASVGGKTGINFNGLKNEIGVFNNPCKVIIDTDFLKTIDDKNFLSGFAEMIKHGLIKNPEHLKKLLDYDMNKKDLTELQKIIKESVNIKEWFVKRDPTEKNIRKALNFGHTAGHAFESFALHKGKPILHGYAVIFGIIAELYLSGKKMGFDKKILQDITGWIIKKYGKFEISTEDEEPLYGLMTHDKKNENNQINFTLLSKIGEVEINQVCSKQEIMDTLNYYRNL